MSIGIATSGPVNTAANGLKRCWPSEGGRLPSSSQPLRSAIPRRGLAVSACPAQQRRILTAHFSAHCHVPLRDLFRVGLVFAAAGMVRRCRCISGSIASGTNEALCVAQNETQTRLFGLVAFVIVVIVRYLHHRSHRPLIPAAGAIARTHPIWLPIAPLRSHRSNPVPHRAKVAAAARQVSRPHCCGSGKTGRHALRTAHGIPVNQTTLRVPLMATKIALFPFSSRKSSI